MILYLGFILVNHVLFLHQYKHDLVFFYKPIGVCNRTDKLQDELKALLFSKTAQEVKGT